MTRYQVSREDRSPDHPSGWEPVAKFGTLRKAELFVQARESVNRWLYSDRNPDREFHCIEAI